MAVLVWMQYVVLTYSCVRQYNMVVATTLETKAAHCLLHLIDISEKELF
ncbi:hypothetical protein [Nostoc sp.]